MPDKAKIKGGSQHFDWPLNGKLRKDVDPMLIGETNFQTLTNFRYTADGIKGIQGMTPINVAALPYTNGVNGFHFKKDVPVESHVFVQGTSGSNSALYKSNNTASIPNQDTFTSFQILENNATCNFSEAPDGGVCICNGSSNRIWEGNEGRCSSFIVFDPGGSFWYDYTDKVTNTLSDAADVARFATSGGGIDVSCKAMWHFDSALTDSSGNSHTLTDHGTMTYVVGRFGNAVNLVAASTQYADIADHADFDFSGNTYSIDGVFNITSLAAINPIYYQRTTADADSFSIFVDTNGAVNLVVKKTASGTFTATTNNGVVTAGNTCQIAVVQAGTILYIFVNGYLKFQGTAPTTIQNYTGNVQIGYNNTVYYGGWIDELRVSNNARWIVPFTVPLVAYSTASTVANVYVGSVRPLQGVKFYVGTANGTAAVATAYQWTGTAWGSLAVTDGTATGGVTLAKTGEISFPSTVTTAKLKAIKRGVAYYYQFVFTGVDASTTIYYCTLDAPMQPTTDLWDGSARQTLECFKYTTSYTDYTTNIAQSTSANPRAYDALDTTTYAQFGGLTSAQYIYCGFQDRQMGLIFNMPDSSYINVVANTIISVDYWTGTAWTTVGVLDDSTSSGGMSLNHTGLVTWSAIAENYEFQTNVANNYQLYYYRVHFNNTLTADVRVDEIGGITAPLEITPHAFSILWQNRLWLFNGINDHRNQAICSGFGTNAVFNGNDSVSLEFGDDKALVGASSLFSRFSSGIYDDLLVFKKNAIFMVDGTSPSNWITYTVSDSIGLVAPLTLQRCDISYAISEGMTKHVVLWRSSSAIEFFDGNSIFSIKDDIQNFFDPESPDFIDPTLYDVSKETSVYDNNNFEYHWFFTNVNGKQEYVYNLKYKKWFNIDRGTGKYLNNAFNIQDTYGSSYVYGLTNDGFIEHLQNGTTAHGNPIVYTFQTGDILLTKSGNYVTKLRHIKLFAKAKNVSSSQVSVTHYQDTSSAGITLPSISQTDATHRVYQSRHSINIDAVMHSLKYTITTNNETIGMEPFLLSGLYDVVREDL